MEIKGRAIYLINEHLILLYRSFAFYIKDLKTEEEVLVAKAPIDKLKKVLGVSRLMVRAMRCEPRCTERLDQSRFVISLMRKIWILDIEKKSLVSVSQSRTGWSDPLNFCSDGVNVYWGEYGTNPRYDEVNIYKIDKSCTVSIAYTFAKGTVRHVHNIIWDNYNRRFWIMVGDNEEKAGIYTATEDFGVATPVKSGEQKYRAVVAFPYGNGLVYATDSVETENYIYALDANGNERILETINGSCIYGCETKRHYLFSTTVEPHEGGGKKTLLTYQLGGGIKSTDVHVVAVSKEDLSVSVISIFKKDIWPMKIFQYGRCIFAKGQHVQDNEIWLSPSACKKYDGKTIKIKF